VALLISTWCHVPPPPPGSSHLSAIFASTFTYIDNPGGRRKRKKPIDVKGGGPPGSCIHSRQTRLIELTARWRS
jgi:hypothetical protein